MTKQKRWSYSAGERGRNRVRIYEDDDSRPLLLEYYETLPEETKPRRRRISLGHCDRRKAKQQADDIAAAHGRAEEKTAGAVTLAELFDIYRSEVTPTKAERSRAHDRSCAEMFLRYFGAGRAAKTLNRRDWDRFVQDRSGGRVSPAGRATKTSVGNRTVARDLKWLRAVLNWAVTAGDAEGNPLLERSPLDKLPYPKEVSPRRPLISQERYEAMLEVAPEVDWRFHVALVLAHETGHRIGAIRLLRWADVNLERSEIRWRGSTDKTRFEHVTPLTGAARSILEEARSSNPAIGDAALFPAPGDPTKPCSRHLVRDWWYQAESRAGLDHVERLGWHALRRKFATELKKVPLKDLCQLGGWKSPQTILTCYQQADPETMRQALETRTQLKTASRTG